MVRGTAYTMVAIFVSDLVLVINSIAVSRLLGSQAFGVLAFVWSFMGLAGVFAVWGIPSAVVKFLAEKGAGDAERAGRIVSAGLLLTTCTATITCAAVVVSAPFLSSDIYGEGAISYLLPAASVALFVSSLPAPVYALLQGFERIRDLNIRNIAYSIASVPITIALVWRYQLVGAAVAGILVALANLGINIRLARRVWRQTRMKWIWTGLRPLGKKIAGYGSAMVCSSLSLSLVAVVAASLLATTSSFSALGEFSVALGLTTYLSFIPTSIGVPMIPALSGLNESDPKRVGLFLTKTLRVTCAVVTPLVFLLQFLCGPLIAIAYGSGYAAATRLVVLLAPAAFMLTFTSIVGFGILGIGRVWDAAALNVLWAAAYGALAWTLVPSMSATGLAIAFTVAYFSHLVLIVVYAKRRFHLPSAEIVPVLVVSLAASAVGLVGWQATSSPPFWIAGAAGACVLALIEWTLLHGGERELLRSIVRQGLRILSLNQ